ncbi:hypothetical protein COU58_01825 [Candidatus Pacearchaeota archaeon CG10_big_fil_rev_8_21_14_0_10_32_42]|nr:MAG: hypothetical protein COU58_01825 [Candidatus Pacearchaeota archaeon CG10_big_fil_rev_8_21_14_0_10_32_42]
MKILFKNSRGQIGETLTWVVATIIILVILIFFIFGSSLLGKTKSVGTFRESLTSSKTTLNSDIFLRKSLFTYLSLTSNDQKQALEKKIVSIYWDKDPDGEYNQTRKEILIMYNKKR